MQSGYSTDKGSPRLLHFIQTPGLKAINNANNCPRLILQRKRYSTNRTNDSTVYPYPNPNGYLNDTFHKRPKNKKQKQKQSPLA